MNQAKQRLSIILLVVLGKTATAFGQTSYNRWEAQPVPPPKVTSSAAHRGAQLIRVKMQQDSLAHIRSLRQDSLRIATAGATVPTLKRGLGARIKAKSSVSEDDYYFHFVSSTIKYPADALRAQTEGTVTVQLTINAVGQVVATDIISSIPPTAPGRDSMIRQARLLLRHLRFEQAEKTTTESLEIEYKIY